MKASDVQALFKSNPALARRNPDVDPARLHSKDKQPGQKLVDATSGEKASGPRFEIVFRIYAVQPQDWSNPWIKGLQDAIVDSGLLPDDDWQTLQGTIITCKAKTKAHECTQVFITRLS